MFGPTACTRRCGVDFLTTTQVGTEAGPAPSFVVTSAAPLPGGTPQYDVVVCGGTLGIFLAYALLKKVRRSKFGAAHVAGQCWRWWRRQLMRGEVPFRAAQAVVRGAQKPLELGVTRRSQS